jgi:hypothetical protein
LKNNALIIWTSSRWGCDLNAKLSESIWAWLQGFSHMLRFSQRSSLHVSIRWEMDSHLDCFV